jgi:Fur family ferric uptake transcriptional regulator
MNEARAIELLEQHGVKPTANRIVVAKALAAAENPMSLAELERKILTIDKSGIFRALTLFREHHLVHVIEGGGEGVKYEFCHSHSHEHDEDVHPHFFCERCQKTFCLDNMGMPDITLPDGFRPRSANLIIKGLCPDCAGGL